MHACPEGNAPRDEMNVRIGWIPRPVYFELPRSPAQGLRQYLAEFQGPRALGNDLPQRLRDATWQPAVPGYGAGVPDAAKHRARDAAVPHRPAERLSQAPRDACVCMCVCVWPKPSE